MITVMRFAVGLALLWVTLALGEDLQVRGDVSDSEDAAIGRATVRLLAEGTRLTLRRCQTDEYGHFDLGAIPSGSYVLAASAAGFRERLLRLNSGEDVQIRLDVVGCDAPGVNCDAFFGSYPEPSPVRTNGSVRLRPSDAVDLSRGKVKPSNNGTDIQLQRRYATGLYLMPLNQARIAQLGAADANCAHGKYERQPVRIDGLGPGADICVVTNRGDYSHLFFTGEVIAASGEVSFYYVTRRKMKDP
jgi:hypothetical protein